jgi:V-type H+-transporting ATPase subunit d
MQDKFVSEFRYIRANAVGAMAEFMDYITYAYMIDNVALLITGTLHERDTKELLDRCHPLGWFETLPVLCAATTVEELYNSVLIESPLEPYFKKGLSHQDLDELNIEIVRNTLFKAYLEDFHQWVNSHPAMSGSPTAEVMTELLEFEADRRAINITLNSFGTELSKQDRAHMYPDIGRLYPHGSQALARADDVEAVRAAVDSVPDFRSAFATVSLGGGSGPGNMEGGSSEGKSLDDLFYQQEMNIAKRAFTRQFTFALVFSWVRLKEQVSAVGFGCAPRVSLPLTRAGNSQHHLDSRVHRHEAKGPDRQLHQRLLSRGCRLLRLALGLFGSCSHDFRSLGGSPRRRTGPAALFFAMLVLISCLEYSLKNAFLRDVSLP